MAYTLKDVREVDGRAVVSVNGTDVGITDITALMADGSATPDHFDAMRVLGTYAKNQLQDADKRKKEQEQAQRLLEQQAEVIDPVLEIAQSVLTDKLGVLPPDFRVSFVARRISIDIPIPEEMASDDDYTTWGDKLGMKGLNFEQNESGEYEPQVKQGTRAESKPLLEQGSYRMEGENVANPVEFSVNDKGRCQVEKDGETVHIPHSDLLLLARVSPEKGELTENGYTEDRPFQWPAKSIQNNSVKVS